MKSLLYILHIDWDWIYQRPQILAKYLENDFDVTVLSKSQVFSKQKMMRNTVQPRKRHNYYILPRAKKYKVMSALTKFLEKIIVWNEKISRKNIVWFCQPNIMNEYLSKCAGFVVYDCMDDYAAMENDYEKRNIILLLEEKMCDRANLIFVSSQTLFDKLTDKGVNSDKIVLVRNGCSNKIFAQPTLPVLNKNKYILGYVGTIAEWMDFDLLDKSQKSNLNIQYNMVGPYPTNLPSSAKNLNFIGRVEHEKLYSVIEDYDCLIMPFIVNAIIKSVDPVKLYEYISYGKCIVSVYYKEIERFADFVYFYHNHDEYLNLIEYLSEKGFPAKYSAEQQKKFLDNNTWDIRGKTVCDAIKLRI